MYSLVDDGEAALANRLQTAVLADGNALSLVMLAAIRGPRLGRRHGRRRLQRRTRRCVVKGWAKLLKGLLCPQ